MSLQSDIMTALASLGANTVWPQAVPEDEDPPFVVYRILNKDPLTTLDNSNIDINSTVAFECYAETYSAAIALAASVKAAIKASNLTSYETTAPGEDYIPLIDGYMEPVFFGFWHT